MITTGTNFFAGRNVAAAILNPSVDNAANATGDASSGGTANQPLSAEPDAASITIQTSLNPVFLSSTAVDVCERTTRGMSSKLFTHFSYTWKDREGWIPYLGIGGEAEFGHNNCNTCETDCDQCISCALSQWGIWLKGGMSF